jgi:hypothetical protein
MEPDRADHASRAAGRRCPRARFRVPTGGPAPAPARRLAPVTLPGAAALFSLAYLAFLSASEPRAIGLSLQRVEQWRDALVEERATLKPFESMLDLIEHYCHSVVFTS